MSELINGRTPEEIKIGCKVCGESFNCGVGCPYYDVERDCMKQMSNDILALIERLEAERDAALAKVPKWISVKEQLPDSRRNILTVNGHGVIRIMALWGYAGEKWKWIEDKKFKYYNDITHWVPLPEPPKEGAHDA